MANALGDYSTAVGTQSAAEGAYTTALGTGADAVADYSTAIGVRVRMRWAAAARRWRVRLGLGENSTSLGGFGWATSEVTAVGQNSWAHGDNATALG